MILRKDIQEANKYLGKNVQYPSSSRKHKLKLCWNFVKMDWLSWGDPLSMWVTPLQKQESWWDKGREGEEPLGKHILHPPFSLCVCVSYSPWGKNLSYHAAMAHTGPLINGAKNYLNHCNHDQNKHFHPKAVYVRLFCHIERKSGWHQQLILGLELLPWSCHS